MKIGNYMIGPYHSIIKKLYEDGSFEYETRFSSRDDFFKSVDALGECVGTVCGIGTDNPKKLAGIHVIIGKEEIVKELETGFLKQEV